MTITIALVLSVLGAALFYLASPHQRWRTRPLPARPTRVVGGACLVMSLFAFVRALTALPGTFAFVSALMFSLVVVTYLGALAKRRTPSRREE